MEFVIVSDYDKGDKVTLKTGEVGTVVDVRLSLIGRTLEFKYLCVFGNSLREWVAEDRIAE